ncbi:MAG: prepilin-type N-terminal cleavage/methylation domain-containing protein [Sedimentisphaerales bacterium]|nr:prepilin-type N-terminal cleavage/methylation domain-containing protein [Sedimentisphaerales bacterium]
MNTENKRIRSRDNGFTFIEIIVVMVILGIAALMAVPMFSSAADIQVRTAANMIAADLEYAKSMAITFQQNYSLVFVPGSEQYQVQDQTGAVITHPTNPGVTFLIDFTADNRTGQVDIVSANFSGASGTVQAVTFDYLGTPYAGTPATGLEMLNGGIVALSADTFNLTVTVEPVTGYVTIQ